MTFEKSILIEKDVDGRLQIIELGSEYQTVHQDVFKVLIQNYNDHVDEINRLQALLDDANKNLKKYLEAAFENGAKVQKLTIIGNQLADALDNFKDEWRVLPRRTRKALENWKHATS